VGIGEEQHGEKRCGLNHFLVLMIADW